MRERRRPGLRRVLGAAARRGLGRIADGVDTVAHSVAALAGGLRSLARTGSPGPPIDPRLADVEPNLAAYVSARDPVWFSFDAPGGEVGMPRAEPTTLIPAAGRRAAGSPDAAAGAPRASAPRWQIPSAAELPGGRPLTPRVPTRRRRGGPAPVPAATSGDPGAIGHMAFDSTDGPAAAPAVRSMARQDAPAAATGLPGDAARRPPSAWSAPTFAQSAPATGSSPHASASTPAPAEHASGARRATSDSDRATAAPHRGARNAAPRPHVAADARRHPAAEATSAQITWRPAPSPWPAPSSPAPSAAGERRSSVPSLPPTHTPWPAHARSVSPSWPDLPAVRAESRADIGTTRAWVAASALDVLVDEQRST
ncbi:hypothetical protein [Microbacterium jiangjiandongii]|uniref:hypothetical protein n=1 Tax=Microbacterium jiangjiandongii TaxID=3049071 RepID=UPI00214C255E|nr:hypothetical protein [Microbacterium sp. zg.Y843]MCR2815102.1 hypothetical protein [Microbacterium sp. zg.Y843]